MFNKLSGEVSITWKERSVTKPLSVAATQLALVVLASVVFTAVIGPIILGISVSIAGLVALVVVIVCGLGASAYIGRKYLLSEIFNDEYQSSQPSDNDRSAPGSVSTDAVETTDAKA